jgi:hypothetical protein
MNGGSYAGARSLYPSDPPADVAPLERRLPSDDIVLLDWVPSDLGRESFESRSSESCRELIS